MKERIFRILTITAVGVLLGTGIAWNQIRTQTEDMATEGMAQVEPAAGENAGTHAATETPVGGPFALTAHDGRKVTEKDFPGYKLMFFGFTHCPDVCPTGLQKISAVLKTLGEQGKGITPLFVTVDPARDTADVMKDYLSLYDERIVGLTGSAEEIKAVTESYRVYAAKAEGADPENYMMNHSGFTYLLRDDGTMVTVFSADDKPSEIAKEIRAILKQS